MRGISAGRLRHDASLEELSEDRPNVLVDDDLGSDQEWERQEKADMDSQVRQERHRDAPADHLPSQG